MTYPGIRLKLYNHSTPEAIESVKSGKLLKKEIVQIPLKDEIPERQICLVYDSQHPMGAAARELKNTIISGCV